MEKPHRNLEAWKQSMDLAVGVYQNGRAETFPSQETYGLTSQVPPSAVSVPSNIAEGAASRLRKSSQIFSISPRALLASWTSRSNWRAVLVFSMKLPGSVSIHAWYKSIK